MTDREEFEKWWRETKGTDIPYTGLASFTEDVMFSAWQARGERIKELEAEILGWQGKSIEREQHLQIANSAVDELTAKLDKAREALNSCLAGDDYYNRPIIEKALEELDK